MPLINSDTRLCDVIRQEPSIIPVVNRFGINLGVGDFSVREVCRSNSIDEKFFLAILNTFINENYFPESALKSFNVAEIVDYLDKTDTYYADFQLSNIERHFNLLLRGSLDKNTNLELMLRFFEGLKGDLLSRIEYDRVTLFPSIISSGTMPSDCPSESFDSGVEDKLGDLKSMFIKHLTGSYDPNLCYGVVVAIVTLEKDIRQNNRIRSRILLPLVARP